MNMQKRAMRIARRKAVREHGKDMRDVVAFGSVVDKRAANNAKRPKGTGFTMGVSDSDPMSKDSLSNWP